MDFSNTWLSSSGFSLKHVMRIAAVVLVLVSLPVAYWAWLRERDLTAVRRYWVDATATVVKGTDDVRHSHGRRSGTHYHHTYYLTLTWTGEAGRKQTATRTVTPGLFSRMAAASPEVRQVSIRYLPGRPDLQPFIATEFTDTENGFLYCAAALFAFGLGAAWLGWPPRRAMAAATA